MYYLSSHAKTIKMKNLFTTIILLFTSGLQAQIREKAFTINGELGRGINFGNMFEAPKENEWGNPWKPEYPAIIAGMGFNHVRIPVRWEPNERSSAGYPYAIKADFLNRIKQVVDSVINNGMYAIVNMHHHEALFQNPDLQKERFIAQWMQISEFFKDYSDKLLFELLNEPHGNLTPEKWNLFIPEVLEVVRKDNPERIILIGTAEYGGIGGLPYLQLPDDEYIILTVHYYNPFQFTHQGADWAGDESDMWLGTEWLDTEDERNSVRQDFAPLKVIELEKKIPVHIGEFGAYEKADLKSRGRWTTFMARYIEELKWSWAYWEFSAGFGVYDPVRKKAIPELENALLHNEMPEPGGFIGTPVYSSKFQDGTDGWRLNVDGSASATLKSENSALKININKVGAEQWYVQLQKCDIPLQANKKYRVSITAKTNPPATITTYCGMTQEPWDSYSGYNSFVLADSFVVYSFIFDMKTTVSNARLAFDIGSSETEIQISEVKVEEITFQPPVGVTGLKMQKSSIYPNPVREKLFFSNTSGDELVTIYDIHGKAILNASLAVGASSLDVSFLTGGVYLVRVKQNNNITTNRFIKF